MAQNTSPKTSKNLKPRTGAARGGRPTKADALRRRIEAAGIDPSLVDPRRILSAIAIDEDAPHAARVTACRTLLAHEARLAALVAAPVADEDEAPMPVDAVTERALALMAAGRGRVQ